MPELPEGTVTFLFSDVEGSTQLLERHGAAMGVALARHYALFEAIIERHGGVIFETVGDAVYAAFGDAAAAIAASLDAHLELAALLPDADDLTEVAPALEIASEILATAGDAYGAAASWAAATRLAGRLQLTIARDDVLVRTMQVVEAELGPAAAGAAARAFADLLDEDACAAIRDRLDAAMSGGPSTQ